MTRNSTEINNLLKEKRRCQSKGDLKGEAIACNALGEEYAQQGLFDVAIDEHKRELQLCEAAGDRIGVATAHRKLGERETERESFAHAFEHLNRYLEIAEEEGAEQEVQRAYVTMGNTHLHKVTTGAAGATKGAEWRRSLHCAQVAYERSLELCEGLRGSVAAVEYQRMKAGALMNLGLVLDCRDEVEASVHQYRAAMSITKQNSSLVETELLCYINVAELYRRHNGLEQAHRYLGQALKCAETLRDKDRQRELHSLRALVYLEQEDHRYCRKSFHRAYRLKPVTADVKESLEKKLKIASTILGAVKLEQCADKLTRGGLTLQEQLKINEKMGDLAASLGTFRLAIKKYQQMLSCAESLGLQGRQLAPVYVSLATTYTDLKDYESAILNYLLEIGCRQDHAQIARSYVNIADCEDRLGRPYSAWRDTYEKALEHATRAGNTRLQRQILKDLLATQTAQGDSEGRARSEGQLADLGGGGSVEGSEEDSEAVEEGEEEEEGTQDVEDDSDVDIEDLSCSDLETDENDKPRQRRANTRWYERRNCKGETALHTACIAGNVKRVAELLEKGHPVNMTDFAGWLPIHEACNHAFPAIVALLIEKGANVNAPGADRTTPLHDVCANTCAKTDAPDALTHGQRCCDVIELLVKNKADVHAKDQHGVSPLHYLQDARRKAQRDDALTRAELQAVRQAEHLLTSVMKGNNPHLQLEICRSILENERALHEEEGESPEHVPRSQNNRPQRRQRPSSKTTPVLDCEELDSQIVSGDSSSGGSGDDPVSGDDDNTTSDSELVVVGVTERGDSLADLDRDPERAKQAYRHCINNMRRSAASVTSLPQPSRHAPPTGRALLSADTYVGDDWLEDDLQQRPTKRKRHSNADLDYFTTGSRKRSRKKSPTSSRDGGEGGGKPARSRGATQRVRRPPSGDEREESDDSDDIVYLANSRDASFSRDSRMVNNSDETRGVDNDKENESVLDRTLTDSPLHISQLSSVNTDNAFAIAQAIASNGTGSNTRKSGPAKQSKLTSFGTYKRKRLSCLSSMQNMDNPITSTQITPLPSAQIPQSSVIMKLRVKVMEETIMVPVKDASASMSWLAEETARRYFSRHTIKPVLSLTTCDGTIFAKEDLVTDMLSNNELVGSVVESWSLTPLPERYSNACKLLQTVVYANVKTLLRDCDASQSLCLRDLALRPTHLQPVLRALENQHSLRELNLQGNRLGDPGMEHLVRCLPTLPSLTSLNLACNQLTALSVATLANALQEQCSASKPPLNLLEVLDLSHNSLGDSCTPALCRLLSRLPQVSSLRMCACHVTQLFFQQHRLAFATALKECRLREIDLSLNRLGCVGVELLLRSLQPHCLMSLDLGSAVSTPTANTLTKHVAEYLLQEQCVLQSLVLSGCHVTGEHVGELCRALQRNTSLQHLSLSANQKLRSCDITALLQSAASNPQSGLQSLELAGCGIELPLATDLLDSISDKLQSGSSLRSLVLGPLRATSVQEDTTSEEAAILKEIWAGKWGPLAQCSVQNGVVTLTEKEEYS